MVEVQHARSVLQGKGKREEGQGSDQVALSRRRKGGGDILSVLVLVGPGIEEQF